MHTECSMECRPDNPNRTLSYFSNITFQDLTVTQAPSGFPMGDITCLSESACTDITLRNIKLAQGVEPPQPVTCKGVASGVEEGVDPALLPPGCTASNNSARISY